MDKSALFSDMRTWGEIPGTRKSHLTGDSP